MKPPSLVYILRGADGCTYELSPSLPVCLAAKAALPYSVQRASKIFVRLGDWMLEYTLANKAWLASRLNFDEAAMELKLRMQRLEEDSFLAIAARYGTTGKLERIANFRHKGRIS
jgi:hypothetical protein